MSTDPTKGTYAKEFATIVAEIDHMKNTNPKAYKALVTVLNTQTRKLNALLSDILKRQ